MLPLGLKIEPETVLNILNSLILRGAGRSAGPVKKPLVIERGEGMRRIVQCWIGLAEAGRWLIAAALLALPCAAQAVAPVSSNQTVSVTRGGTNWFYLALTDTDTAISSTNMTVTVVSAPAHGTVQSYPQVNPGQSGNNNYIRYIATNAEYMGTDTFTWYARDNTGGTSGVATATIVITGVLPAPQIQTVLVEKNKPTVIYPSFTGGGGYTCTVHCLAGGYQQGPYHGSVVRTNNATQFVYTSAANFDGGPIMVTPADDPPGGMDYFLWHIDYSNATTNASTVAVPCYINITDSLSTNADWTQWRHDELRTAQTPVTLPSSMYLQWRRDLPTSVNPYNTFQNAEYCRPVQLGKTLFVSLVANDSVSAYDTDTGAQKWRYYAGGALRRPPVAVALTNGTNVVIFGCDDGYVYCLNGADGSEVWKFRAAPNAKKAMGFGRLSSVWPVWASPTVYQGKVYFVAGLFPSWCLYAYCLDPATGAVLWKNDGRMLRDGWTSAMGPPTFSFDHTLLYGTSGMNKRWSLDADSGEVEPVPSGHPNGESEWTKWNSSYCKFFVDGNGRGASDSVTVKTGDGTAVTPVQAAGLGVVGTVADMLAGDGKLFVATAQGSLYCFGGVSITPVIYTNAVTPLPVVNDVWKTNVQTMLSRDELTQGLALVWGVGSGRLVEELAKQAPGLMVVAADPDPAKLRSLREKMDAAGWSGARVSTLLGNPMECGFAPYQAAIVASEDTSVAGYPAAGSGDASNGLAMVKLLYNSTRPFYGEIWLPATGDQHAAMAGWATNFPLFEVARQGGFTQLRRTGLPDAGMKLKPPFRLIAFGDLNASLARSPSGLNKGVKNGRDIYSWLPATAATNGYEPPAPAVNNNTNWTYRWTVGGAMWNSLYARTEVSAISDLQHAGLFCGDPQRNNFFRYDDLFMVSGKWVGLENKPENDMSQFWGAFNLPDRGGCGSFGTGGSFAGNGIFTFAGYSFSSTYCLCAPGLWNIQGELVSVGDDQNEENWIEYRPMPSSARVQEEPVRQIGINLGGVADKFVPEEQTVWTHHPAATRYIEAPVLLPVSYRGNVRSVYRHSAQMDTTVPLSKGWVSASQVIGLEGLTVPLAMPLVAKRSATSPALDGDLSDACWSGSDRTEFPPVRLYLAAMGSVNSNNFLKLRYDDDNLYVAACVPAPQSGTRYIYGSGWNPVPSRKVTLTLNSRERSGSDVVLTCGQGGSSSTGIGTNQWQSAWSTNTAPFAAEFAIPWSALAGAGLWKDQLIMNVELCPSADYAGGLLYADNCFGPVYMDAARGAVTTVKPYTVKLYFAEMEDRTAGQRVFDVKLQGNTVLTNLDVANETGGPRRELVKTFNNIRIADKLDVDFTPGTGEPMLSGVELIGTYTNPVNAKPVALADASVTSGSAPLAVTLSAQRSYDPDGQIEDCVWETGDGRLARGPVVQHVFAEPGVYKVNLLAIDNRGGTAASSVTVTVTAGVPASFVSRIRASGGDYASLTAWDAALESDLTSPSNLLFAVSGAGNYAAATDDGKAVAFTGGGAGTLKHINAAGVAYIAECLGALGTGSVTVAGSGHTFSVADTGHPVYTVVAECYNDWTNGLADNPALNGWITDENRCLTIRAAAGQGHTGKPKNANGSYTGFAVGVIDASKTPFSRFERLILTGTQYSIFSTGVGASVNRVVNCIPSTTAGLQAIIANSMLTSIGGNSALLLNCTGTALYSGNVGNRIVNCLSLFKYPTYDPNTYARSYCVSVDGSATNLDQWGCGNEGNKANLTVSFVDAANKDYHLAAADTGARGQGVAGLGADIDGQARLGAPYDVGADQASEPPTNIAPVITAQPANLTVTAGSTATFSVTATGAEPLYYQWRTNGTAVAGAGSASYTTPATALGDSGKLFSVSISNVFGDATSDDAMLTVVPPPVAPSITGQPSNMTVTAGDVATFGVTASGTAPLFYQWRMNGTNIAGATAPSYTTPAMMLGDNGALFSVAVSNIAGRATSDNAILSVHAYDGFFITASAVAMGTVSPSGTVAVLNGTSRTFTMTPAIWWAVADVRVDGVSAGALPSYTFSNLTTNHTLTASFTALLAARGTPQWWLAQYGWTNDFTGAELGDQDGDGVATWREFLAGTNPTNPLARPAYNTVPYAESFENLAGWGGLNAAVSGRMGWSSGTAGVDQSRIANLTYAYTATNLPLSYATHTNVLCLDTQGGALTNSFGGGFEMSGALVYIDYMTRFDAAEEMPEALTMADTGIKCAVYANASTQLAVYHGVASADGTLLSNKVDATSVFADATNWHRVTIAIDATATNPSRSLAMFQVKFDGTPVSNAAAYGNGWKAQFETTGTLPPTDANGTWFRLATTNAEAGKLMSLSFNGAGYADDMLVTTADPFGALGATFTLIVARSGNGVSSLGAAPYVSEPVVAGTTTQIVYTADEWNRISSLDVNNVAAPAASGARIFTQLLANIGADVSNAVTFAQVTPVQTGYTNVPTTWLTNWTEAAVNAGGGDDFEVGDKYLLGLDPTSSNTYRLKLDALAVSGSNVTIAVRRFVTGALSPDGMHGHLLLQGTHKFGAAFSNIAATAVTGADVFDGAGRRTYTNATDGAVRFFKAIVE